MKKKLISVLLCATMVAGMAVGCSSSKEKESGSEKTTLTVWLAPLVDDTEGTWKPLLKDFEEKNNCEVDMEIIPWDTYEEKWSTAMAAGEGPDVGYMYVEMFPTYITSGAVVDMSDMFTEEDKEEYLYLDRGYMMDGQYGMPLATGSPFVMFYNEDILNSIGETAPDTWEDFERICKKATQDTDGDGKIDQYGYGIGLNSGDMSSLYILNSFIYSLIWQSGGDIYNDDLQTVRFNDEAGVEALEFFKSLQPYMPENVLSLSATDAFSTVFGEGKAAFGVARAPQTVETMMKESYPKLENWDYVTSLKNKQYGTFGAADSLTLMSASENQELAFEFIKYVTGAKFQTAYHAAGGSGIAMTATEAKTFKSTDKMSKIINEDRAKWRPLQAGPCGSEILEDLSAHVQMIMEGTMTPQEALDDSAKFGNETLKEFWADNQ